MHDVRFRKNLRFAFNRACRTLLPVRVSVGTAETQTTRRQPVRSGVRPRRKSDESPVFRHIARDYAGRHKRLYACYNLVAGRLYSYHVYASADVRHHFHLRFRRLRQGRKRFVRTRFKGFVGDNIPYNGNLRSRQRRRI